MNANTEYVKVRDEDLGVVFYAAKARLEAITKKRNITEPITWVPHLLSNAMNRFPLLQRPGRESAFQVHCDDFVTLKTVPASAHGTWLW